MVGFRGLDSSINLNSKGWNSQAHRELPGKFHSSNLSRDTVSREIGRNKKAIMVPRSLRETARSRRHRRRDRGRLLVIIVAMITVSMLY